MQWLLAVLVQWTWVLSFTDRQVHRVNYDYGSVEHEYEKVIYDYERVNYDCGKVSCDY